VSIFLFLLAASVGLIGWRSGCGASAVLNPSPSVAASTVSPIAGSPISPQNSVLTDIQHGELAQVTWIVPDWSHSDHPGSGSEGPDWVASIVNVIGKIQFWSSTAIFDAWDDWGGWCGHVAPPEMDAMRLGFRVPLLVISPWAKQGYVSHHIHEASGFIAFIEHNFGLGTLETSDAVSDDYLDYFDTTQTPLHFPPIPTRIAAERLVRERDSGRRTTIKAFLCR
jgi:phospholipase C